MIPNDRYEKALCVIHRALCLVRNRLYEYPVDPDIIGVVDCLEYLPRLFVMPNDETDTFRMAIDAICQRLRDCDYLRDEFESHDPPNW